MEENGDTRRRKDSTSQAFNSKESQASVLTSKFLIENTPALAAASVMLCLIFSAQVPVKRWLFNIVLFFSINVLNNHAFSYDISVPVHIILRSGGSIATMIAGYLYGKKYSRLQALAVMLLSSGVVLAAWSDAQEKVDSPISSQARPL
ncbi:hypothetical protein E4U41_005563 [Claviceps citrina]|nr:hypothetical protein E4U41_005563 [Claviceps citrina]